MHLNTHRTCAPFFLFESISGALVSQAKLKTSTVAMPVVHGCLVLHAVRCWCYMLLHAVTCCYMLLHAVSLRCICHCSYLRQCASPDVHCIVTAVHCYTINNFCRNVVAAKLGPIAAHHAACCKDENLCECSSVRTAFMKQHAQHLQISHP